ncbi:MAG: hypothetical protein WA705_16275 [Candidatus Ozemobacteraceae bacterium]
MPVPKREGNRFVSGLSRRGVLLPTVLLVLFVLGILAMQYSRWASYSQALAYRYEQSEVARRLAESAIDEAFARFFAETGKSGSLVRKRLIDNEKNPSDVQGVAVPTTIGQASSMIRGLAADITVTVRSVDFRDVSPSPKNYPFYKAEGVGTLGFVSTVLLMRGSKKVAGCVLERHHDFKVTSMLSPRSDRGNRYAENFLLDYVVFVRNGLSEFNTTFGFNLNNDNLDLTVIQDGTSPDKYGKIYFGGTDDVNNYVFLNMSGEFQGMIPPLAQTLSLGKSEMEILWPKSKGQSGDPKGELRIANVPLWHPPTPVQKLALNAVLGIAPGGWAAQGHCGIRLLQDAGFATSQNARAIFEGNVRQRFLYFVEHQVTYPDGTDPLPAVSVAAAAARGITSGDLYDVYKGLETLKANGFGGGIPLVSSFSVDCLYACPNDRNTTFSILSNPPKFLDNASLPITSVADARFRPYNHLNLWSRLLNSRTNLEEYGYIVGNELHVRGIVRVFDNVVFDRPLKIVGQGVIIANGFYLKEELVKKDPASTDFVVLYAREGNIFVETNKQIEAALMAVTDNNNATVGRVRVQPGYRLNLKGALSADYLDTSNWPTNKPHVIHYDPVFRSSDDQYQVNISRWVTFTRTTESDS